MIFFFDWTLDKATYNCPWANTGLRKSNPIYGIVWSWALLRVFKLKLKSVTNDLFVKGVLGKVIAHVHVINNYCSEMNQNVNLCGVTNIYYS